MGTGTPQAAFARLLQRHRRAAGLTQEELAERAHPSVRGISNLERGVRRLPQRGTVALLAEALGLAGAERAALEAAEAVCAGEGLASEAVLDLLAGLVAKSLVLPEEGGAGARYQLLETVRQYGWEKLAAAGEEAAVRDRHLGWCLALARQAEPRMGTPEQQGWLDRLEAELENLRTALNWSRMAGGRPEVGLWLAAAVENFWYMRGYASEGRRWLEDLIARGGASVALRARALDVLALLNHYQGEEAPALALFEESYALHVGDGNTRGAAWSLTHQALVTIYMGEHERATPLLEQALPAHRAHGDRHGIGWTLNYLAQIQQLAGYYAKATALYEESLAVFETLGDKFALGDQFAHLANVARTQGDYKQARLLHCQGLRVLRDLVDKPGLAKCFEGLAMVAAAEGHPAKSAQLFGVAHCLRETIGTPVELVDRTDRDRALADARAALGEDAFAAAWAAGHAMGLEETIAQALQETSATPPLETSYPH